MYRWRACSASTPTSTPIGWRWASACSYPLSRSARRQADPTATRYAPAIPTRPLRGVSTPLRHVFRRPILALSPPSYGWARCFTCRYAAPAAPLPQHLRRRARAVPARPAAGRRPLRRLHLRTLPPCLPRRATGRGRWTTIAWCAPSAPTAAAPCNPCCWLPAAAPGQGGRRW